MAHARIDQEREFLEMLNKTTHIAKILQANYIVVHPSKCNHNKLEKIFSFTEKEVDPILEDYDVNLYWEIQIRGDF